MPRPGWAVPAVGSLPQPCSAPLTFLHDCRMTFLTPQAAWRSQESWDCSFTSIWLVPGMEPGTQMATQRHHWMDGCLQYSLYSSPSSLPCFSLSGPKLVTCRAHKTNWDKSLSFLINKKRFCLSDFKFSQERWSSSRRLGKPPCCFPWGSRGLLGCMDGARPWSQGKDMMDQAD